MYPVLCDIAGVTVFSYGVFVLLGALLVFFFGLKTVMDDGEKIAPSLETALFATLMAFLGAKLLYVLVEWRHYSQYPSDALYLWDGGVVFAGGLAAALPAAYFYAKKVARIDPFALLDRFTPGILLGHAVGRIGCFLAGCCYGGPSGLPWAVTYTDPRAQARLNYPLHPVQLYEALILVGLFFYFWRKLKKSKERDGRIFAEYLLYYPIARIVLEFYRGDRRGGAGPFSTSQFAMLGLLAAGLYFTKKFRAKSP